MASCIHCGKGLRGRQTKFCSRHCKNCYGNNRFQSYLAQQARGRARKLKLIAAKGGKCQVCGYCRNHSALEFHHVDPATKLFNLDLRALSNRKWAVVCDEAQKCVLLCSNCHKEIHNPDSLICWPSSPKAAEERNFGAGARRP